MSVINNSPHGLACRRCGTCCLSGPPALHGTDMELYTTALVTKGHLITFRRGEWVHDNVQDKVLCLDQEMVRIRSLSGSRTCIYYDHGRRACKIYDNRPLECRTFACWEPDGLLQIYAQDRVQRLDLISARSALGQIIAEHEDMCSWPLVLELLEPVKKDPAAVQAKELTRILKADQEFRRGLRERAGATATELNFLLGRDMAVVLPHLGLRAVAEKTGYRFEITRTTAD